MPVTTTHNWRITIVPDDQLPRHIFIVFISGGEANPQEQNKMMLSHFNLTKVYATINSRRYPDKELKCDFTPATLHVSRTYTLLLESMQKYQESGDGSQITLTEFVTIYTIFHFDVSKHSKRLSGPCDIEINFTLAANPVAPFGTYALITSHRYIDLEASVGKMLC